MCPESPGKSGPGRGWPPRGILPRHTFLVDVGGVSEAADVLPYQEPAQHQTQLPHKRAISTYACLLPGLYSLCLLFPCIVITWIYFMFCVLRMPS